MKLLPLTAAFLIAMTSCGGSRGDERPVPRRYAYPRLPVPEVTYRTVRFGGVPLEISSAVTVAVDSAAGARHDITLSYQDYGADIYLTVSHAPDADSLRSMASERAARYAGNVAGHFVTEEPDSADALVICSYSGNVTPVQFVALSGLSMLTGVVHFADPEVAVKSDSVRPLFEALHADVDRLVKSFSRP